MHYEPWGPIRLMHGYVTDFPRDLQLNRNMMIRMILQVSFQFWCFEILPVCVFSTSSLTIGGKMKEWSSELIELIEERNSVDTVWFTNVLNYFKKKWIPKNSPNQFNGEWCGWNEKLLGLRSRSGWRRECQIVQIAQISHILSKLQTDRVWGGDFKLRVASHALNVNIFILS